MTSNPHIIENFATAFEGLDNNSEFASAVHFPPISENIFLDTSADKLTFEDIIRAQTGPYPIHIGTAGVANFDLIYATQARAALLLDVNPNQRVMWDRVIEIIKHCPTIEEAAEKLTHLGQMMQLPTYQETGKNRFQKIQSNDPFRPNTHVRDYYNPYEFNRMIQNYNKNKQSWLGSQERYDYVRALILRNAIGVATVDMCNLQHMQELSTRLERVYSGLPEGKPPLLCYLSNLLSFQDDHNHKDTFYKRSVNQPRTAFLRGLDCILSLTDTVIAALDFTRQSAWPMRNIPIKDLKGYTPTVLSLSELKDEALKSTPSVASR